jgi:hypothetical protein
MYVLSNLIGRMSILDSFVSLEVHLKQCFMHSRLIYFLYRTVIQVINFSIL